MTIVGTVVVLARGLFTNESSQYALREEIIFELDLHEWERKGVSEECESESDVSTRAGVWMCVVFWMVFGTRPNEIIQRRGCRGPYVGQIEDLVEIL